jgi:tyrosinase
MAFRRCEVLSKWAFLAIFLIGAGGCATVPTRPNDLLPLVEVQLNNTATHRDDITSILPVAQLPGRMRISNPQSTGGIQADVAVVLTNIQDCGTYCGHLRFSPTGAGPFLSTYPMTLPRDGSWVPFVVRGMDASLTVTDAVMEIRENIGGGNVLGRYGVFVSDNSSLTTPALSAVIDIARTPGTLDDYLTWTAMPATIRLTTPNSLGGPLSVVLRNAAPVAGADPPGRVVFGLPSSGGPPVPSGMTPTLSLSLPSNGAPVDLYVAGEFLHPSVRDKDAIIEVINPAETNPDKALLENIGAMVRIRKNANALTTRERDRFLRALTHMGGLYTPFVQINAAVGTRAYSANSTTPSPAFLPWHRAFLLRLERELQGLDPSVALPYWRYDLPAINVFTKDFMGESDFANAGPVVLTAMTNPLHTWAIQRLSSFGAGSSPTSAGPNSCWTQPENVILTLLGMKFLNGTQGFWAMEWLTSDKAVHAAAGDCTGVAGQTGWLAQPATAVQDPLFFLLYANTDRLWAKWQLQNGRSDPGNPDSYAAANCGLSAGQCLLDTMWPWNNSGAPDGPFPIGLGRYAAPPSMPTPGHLLDVDRSHFWTSSTSQWSKLNWGLGYSYDDVGPTN